MRICHVLLIHLPVDGTLGFSSPQFWVVTNKAAIDIYVQVFYVRMFSFHLGKYLRVELLDKCMFNIFKKPLSSSPSSNK